MGAALIDGIIISIPASILFFVLIAGAVGITGDDSDASVWAIIGASILWFIVVAVIAFLYAPITMSRDGAHNGQTWGKQMLGIRVVRDSGEQRRLRLRGAARGGGQGPAVRHRLLDHPDHPLAPGRAVAAVGRREPALHDMIVSTHVMKA